MKDKYKESYFKRLKANPEKYALYLIRCKKASKDRYHKNIEISRKIEREKYQKNKVSIAARKNIDNKKWRLNNPFKAKYRDYTQSAKVRNLLFDICFEDFVNLLKRNCSYCNIENANGIDRKDNKLGYTLDNSIPCCSICNYMKGSVEYNYFIDHCKKIIINNTNYNQLNNINPLKLKTNENNNRNRQ